ncbi:Membrane-bound lytic murein transglycosylase F [Methanocorpusculaceae archaeon Ag1]|uniref:Membrane-bound lytic murein transglycosylase F n=1 Tax=Methanorbis furvi TaxID=3028299 RepID=A0AAE4MB92_9EURY|nr:Membrane-bound lytic murein transglycosylase F [Methanocorpusculaceae archaeon Ag1]
MIIATRKNTLSIFIIVLLLLGVLIAAAGCVQEKPTYVVAVSPSFSPFSMQVQGTGEAYGIDIDVLNAIAEDQGIRFVYEFWDHAVIQSKLDNGEIDLITAWIITPKRQEKYLFSDPYIVTGQTIVVRKDSNLTIDDVLSGNAIIAYDKGSVYENLLEEHFGTETFNKMVAEKKIIAKYTQDATLYAILTREADAVIGTDFVLGEKLHQYSPLTSLGYITDKNDVGFVADKSNEELIAKINAGLANIVASEKYDKIMQKHHVAQLKDEYLVGISEENWPFTYVGEDGNLTGFDTESLEWIAEKNGFTVTYVNIPWSKNINAVATGKVDMWYSGMVITDERSAKVSFSTPYYAAGVGVGCAKNRPITKNNFESGTVVTGYVTKTIMGYWLEDQYDQKRYAEMVETGMIKEYATTSDLLNACLSGEVDCIVVHEPLLKSMANQNDIQIVSTYDTKNMCGVAIQNGNIPLQDLIDRGLADLEASGKRAELMEKYHLS